MTRKTNKVLLIGIDGADWNLMSPLLDAGDLPFIKKLVEGGTVGNLSTISPTLSPILWNSIATGKRAAKHGILGFTEVDPGTSAIRPVSSLSRQCKAAWNILQQNGFKVHVVNWFASQPAEPINGVAVSDFFPNTAGPTPEPWPVPPGSVHPADRAEHYAPMRVHPSEVQTDIGSLFVRDIDAVDQEKDPRPGELARELARAFTVQTTALDIMDSEPWDFLAVYFRTVDILCHMFMTFHPPRMDDVPEDLFDQYSDGVNSAYRLLNLMLTSLIERAGPDTTVLLVSDHGFYHDHLRPTPKHARAFREPEAWHRDQGVLMAHGPGIRKDELIHGAGILDITPTILGLYGLPVGKDMDGRVLTRLFEKEPEVAYIESWEEVEGDCGMHPPGTELPEADAKALIAQFVALGYIQPPHPDQEQAAEQTRLQNLWHLARDYVDCAEWERSLPLLEELHDKQYGLPETSVQLAYCLWLLGLNEEAELAAGDVLRLVKEGPMLSMLLGHLAGERGDTEEAIAHYRKAAELVKDQRALNMNIGRAWLRVKRLDEAEAAFRAVLEAEPENAVALQGLARTHLVAERWQEAAEAALDAVALQHALPTAHAILGKALVHLGYHEDAVRAYETSLVYDANQQKVHEALGHLYEHELKDLQKALPHQVKAEALRREREGNDEQMARLKREMEERRLAREENAIWAQSETPEDLAREVAARSDKITRQAQAQNADKRLEPGTEFVIVSGLPRSGTSLMMQMLAAGGMNVMTDGVRGADDFNPEGYFEWEQARELPMSPYVIGEAQGRAVKVLSMLLPHLPPEYHYKVLFMDRPVEEVASSQERMVQHDGGEPAEIRPALEHHRSQALKLLKEGPHFDMLLVSYPKLVLDGRSELERIRGFLSQELDIDAMASAARPELYRVRLDD